ncbi:hypothetical protein AX16_002908 [Volvariella volvacea WC 439]|nr:hypothetical protein AX16_002908 [Volvariella volvacea WC 439]
MSTSETPASNSNASKKRKRDDGKHGKRVKLTSTSEKTAVAAPIDTSGEGETASHPTIPSGDRSSQHDSDLVDAPSSGEAQPQNKGDDKAMPSPEPRVHRRKLAPPRPWPTVPPSASATGPRSAFREGKNYICITNKTKLGAYMRRCKELVIEDGFKTLHLSAMGAAIPKLLQLTMALPPILPFAGDEISIETTTGTVEVQDEILPEDEDQDIQYEAREKSTLLVILKIGNGEFEGSKAKGRKGKSAPGSGKNKGVSKAQSKPPGAVSEFVVFEEPEQDIEI